MKKTAPEAVSLGDVVAAAFEAAEQVTHDERLTSVLATETVGILLTRNGRSDLVRQLAAPQVNAV